MADLGQLSIEFQGDFSRLQRDIERVKADAIRYAKELEKTLTLSVGIDTRSLQSEAAKAGKSAATIFNTAFNDGIKNNRIQAGLKIDNSQFKAAGKAAAQGLVVGLESGNSDVKKAANKMATVLVDETKQKLRIKSPSGVFKDIGADIVRGLEAGLGSFTSASLFAGLNNLVSEGIQGIKSLVSGGFNFVGDSIGKYSDLKSITNQLKLVEGSAESLSFVRAEANRLSLSIDVAQKSFVSLAASAKGTSLAGKETKELFSAVSEAARVYGLSNEQYQGSVLALSQIISKGTVSSEELRGQLAERLPGAFQIAARSIGVTSAQLQKLLETGQLTATEFLPRFAQQLRTELAGGVTGASETSQASISKLQNKILGLQESLGKAVEPAVIAGLSFASATLDSFASSNAFDDLNKSAKDFRDFLSQNPQLAKDLGKELSGLAKDAMAALGSQAKSLLEYLKQHPTAIRDSVKAMGEFAASIGRALDFALKLVKPLADAAGFIASTEGKLQQAQQPQANRSGSNEPIDIKNLNPVVAGLARVSQFFGLNKDLVDSSAFTQRPISILNNPDKAHHRNGRAYGGGGDGQTYRNGLLVKDLVIAQDGKQIGAPVPAPIGGIVRKRTDDPNGYGNYVDIENQAGKLLARFGHLSKFGDVSNGQAVKPGQVIGYQGSTGRSSGPHLHIELPKDIWQTYVQALKTGNYSTLPNILGQVNPAATPQRRQATNASIAGVDQNLGWKTAVASHYGLNDGFDGQRAANGSIFRKDENTVAHKTLPFGTQVEFRGANGQTQVAKVTDRGPFIKGRDFDLSSGLAARLGTIDQGVASIQYRILGKGASAAGNTSASKNPPASIAADASGAAKPQDTPATIAALLRGVELEKAQARNQTLRDSQGQVLAVRDRVINSEFSAIKNPTIDQKNQNEINSIILTYDSQIRDISARIQDTKSRLEINQNKLKGGGLASEVTDSLNNQITADKKAITEYISLSARAQKARKTALTEATEQQSNESQYKAEQQRFNLSEAELKQLQEKIGYFKQLNQDNPDDRIALKLPELQKEFDIKSAGLELDKQIVDIRQRASKGELTDSEAQARITALDEYNQYQEHRINLEYQSAKSAIALQTAQKNLSQSLRESSDYLQILQRDLQKSQLGLGGNAIALQKEIGSLSSQNAYDQGVLSLMGEKLDPREQERRLQQLDQQMADEAVINEAQARKQGKKRQLSSSQSVLSSYQNLFDEQGGNDKGVSRILGKAQLNLDYESKLSDLTDLRDSGELTNSQFIAMKKNLEAVNEVKLSKLEGQFDILKEPLNDLKEFGQTALKDLITGSKSLSDTLSDLASTLANTFASSAVESIFNDLLGGNKGSGLFSGESSGGSGGGITGIIGSLFGFADGGLVPSYASGGLVGQMQKESAQTGRRSHLVIASEGERILNLRETAIWERLNRPVAAFATGGIVGSGAMSGSDSSINISIPINVGGQAKEAFDQGKQNALRQSIIATVIRERSPGGALYNI
jgi:rare lipoprotein A